MRKRDCGETMGFFEKGGIWTYRICAPGGFATAVAEEREEVERAGVSESDYDAMGRKEKVRNWRQKLMRML